MLSIKLYINKNINIKITLQIAFGSTCDPSSQMHIGPFDPEVQIKLHST